MVRSIRQCCRDGIAAQGHLQRGNYPLHDSVSLASCQSAAGQLHSCSLVGSPAFQLQLHESEHSSMHLQCSAVLTSITRCLMWAAVSLVSARVVPLSWTRSGMTLEAPSPAARPRAYVPCSLVCHGQSCRPQSPSRCFVASTLRSTGAGQAQPSNHVGNLGF